MTALCLCLVNATSHNLQLLSMCCIDQLLKLCSVMCSVLVICTQLIASWHFEGLAELASTILQCCHNSVCMQGSGPASQHMTREQSAGVSGGRGVRDAPQRLQRQHSELPFHSTGRTNPNTSTERARADSRSRQAQSSSDAFGSVIATARPESAARAERQNSGVRFVEPGSGNSTKLDHASRSSQHSRQKSRPSPANQLAPRS